MSTIVLRKNKTRHTLKNPPLWDLFENLSVMEAPSLPNRTLSYFGSGLQVQSPYLWISRACISYYRALIPLSNRIHYKKNCKIIAKAFLNIRNPEETTPATRIAVNVPGVPIMPCVVYICHISEPMDKVPYISHLPHIVSFFPQSLGNPNNTLEGRAAPQGYPHFLDI